MLKIAILGCGQIGSRHLQSLALLEEPAVIYLVDPVPGSLDTARSRFTEALPECRASEFSLIACSQIEELPTALNIVIVATGSAQRAETIRSLLSHTRPEFLILEKFLFQRLTDYAEIETLLSEKDIPCFVNQWISSLYTFRRIAEKLGQGPFQMSVTGAGWGLCCNAVHFLEYFDYLTGRRRLDPDREEFTSMIPSKRPGYFELNGLLSLSASDGSSLTMECENGAPHDGVSVTIRSAERLVAFAFGLDSVACRWENGDEEAFQIPMQSRLTHRFVESLVIKGTCGLPDFARSSRQHQLLLQSFLKGFSRFKPSIGDICPIT